MSKQDITIYHNPRCSKSRKTLEILRENDLEPTIVEYLNHPPTSAELDQILGLLQLEPRDLLRSGEAEYRENNFSDPELSRSQLLDLMSRFPRVIERPIVVADGKAVIGRPPENVLALIK